MAALYTGTWVRLLTGREHLVELVRHDRRELMPVRVLAVLQRVLDLGITPLADAGVRVGRDVGTLDLEGWRVPFDHAARMHLRRRLDAARTFRGVAIATRQNAVDQIAAALDRRLLRRRGGRHRHHRNQAQRPSHHDILHFPAVVSNPSNLSAAAREPSRTTVSCPRVIRARPAFYFSQRIARQLCT
jgi:hypothetical protein